MTLEMIQGRAGSSASLVGLLEYGNEPEADLDTLRSEVSEQVANYLAEVRKGKRLPKRHFYDSRFFAEVPSARPESERRPQFTWDELGPDRRPLRAEEIVHFTVRGEWLGRVDTILEDRFAATLWDRADSSLIESGEFHLEQVSRPDMQLLCEGAFFYWTIGYRENGAGERSSASQIRFRRVRPQFPLELTHEAEQRARRTIDRIRSSARPSGD